MSGRSQKLTLLVPSASIRRARSYAKRTGTSLSAIVDRAFSRLETQMPDAPRAPYTHALTGLIALNGRNDEDVLIEALMERHGLSPTPEKK